MVYGNSTFADVTLKALNKTIPTVLFGIPVTNLTAGSGNQRLFKLVVPYSSSERLLVISLSGGSGNANLFVRRSYPPTTMSYGWSSRKDNNEEDVYINYRSSGTFHFHFHFHFHRVSKIGFILNFRSLLYNALWKINICCRHFKST